MLNLDKFNCFRDEQLQNIDSILVTLKVSNDDMFNSSSEEQPLNIKDISVTELVSNDDNLIFLNWNNY